MDWTAIFEVTIRNLIGPDACYFAIAALGLNVQFGYTGLLNFGQAGFMAAGAYGVGMTAQYFEISMWWGIVVGTIYAVVLGLIVGVPIFRRLRPDYLAIVTIAMAELIRLIVRSVKYKKYFGGSDGINNFSGSFYDLNPFSSGKRYDFGPFEYGGRELWVMCVGWTMVALFALFVWLLMRSPWGRVVKAIREDEDAVRSLGKNVYSYQMQSLIIGGILGMFAGLLFALSRGSVQPDNYSRDVTFYILTALVLGGLAKVSGSIVGPMIYWSIYAFAEVFLIELVKSRGGTLEIGPIEIVTETAQIGQIRFMMVGLGLMFLMIFRPQGIFGNRREMALDGR